MNPDKIFCNSFWIWPISHSWDIHNSYSLFRKEFELVNVPEKPILYITADQSYQLYINGTYVHRGPARGFQASWPYDEIDIHDFLTPGKNLISVRCHSPNGSNFQYLSCGFAGLLVAAQWDGFELVSDETWRSRRQSGVKRDTAPLSMQLFSQEHIDLSIEDPTWFTPEYDDSSWDLTSAAFPWNSMPWYALEERGIPLLDQEIIEAHRCIGQARLKSSSEDQNTRDIVNLRATEGLTHEKCDLDPTNLEIPTPPAGFARSYLIDFGKTVVGSVRIEVEGALGEEVIDSFHVETIDKETLVPDFLPEAFCRMAFGNRMTCRPGDQAHEFYHIIGFRYVMITVRNSRSDLRLRLSLRQALYPMIQKGRFSSSDELLEKIWSCCAWTQRVCSIDAYVDTPWREQAQWWGDARIQAKNTFFYSGDDRLFQRGLKQIAQQTAPNGLTYGHAPTMAHMCILPDFSLIWIITLWDDYWQTGTLDSLQRHRPTVDGILRYFDENSDPATGLVLYDRRYWLFLDWIKLPREGYSSVYNLWLLIALNKLIEMYSLLGEQTEVERLTAWASRLSTNLRKMIGDYGLVGDGLSKENLPFGTTSIHAQTLAIMAQLDPKTDEKRIQHSLLPAILDPNSDPGRPSSYWINYVFQVLSERGFGTEVVSFIRKHWEKMAEHGTTWEVFDPIRGDQSFSHAWSAHPLYHFMEIIGGIYQKSPGWNEVLFAPTFVGDHGGADIPTPHGLIQSKWKKVGSGIDVELVLPQGISATVTLPGHSTHQVLLGGRWQVPLPEEAGSPQ